MGAGHDKGGQGASAFRAYLRALPDDIAAARDAGLPVVLERTSPLAPHAQRLMDALGVEVRIVTQPVTGRQMGRYLVDAPPAEPFVENTIDYRHSVVQANKRADAGDETLEICPHCMCEVDVDPQPHRPGCAGIGAPRTTSVAVLSRATPSHEPEPTTSMKESPTMTNTRWTRDALLAAFRRFYDEHGRWPLPSDAADFDYLPSRDFGRSGNPELASWQAVWNEVDAGKLPQGRGAAKYKQTGQLSPPAEAAARREPPATPDPAAAAEVNTEALSLGERLDHALRRVVVAREELLEAQTDVEEIKNEIAELAA